MKMPQLKNFPSEKQLRIYVHLFGRHLLVPTSLW